MSRSALDTFRLAGLTVVGLATVAGLLWLSLRSSSHPSRTANSSPEEIKSTRRAPHDRPPDGRRDHSGPVANAKSPSDTGVAPNERAHAQTTEERPSSDTGDVAAPSTTDATTGESYRDPVNRRVLGPQSWMAQPSDAQAASIRRDFERDVADPTQFPVTDPDRLRATQNLHSLADTCGQRHLPTSLRGHLTIRADLIVEGQTARLRDIQFDDVVRLDNADFFDCLTQRAARLDFDAERDGRMSVTVGYRHR